MIRVFRALRYAIANLIYTTWASLRVIWASLRDVTGPRAIWAYEGIPRQWANQMLRATRIRLERDGVEKIPDGPVVFVSNHSSWVDIWVLLAGIPKSVRFIFKKELSKIPLLGRALRASGHFEIDRENRSSAFAAYDRAAAQIRSGRSAVVFAEGTRSRSGRLLPFKKGPFVLAISSQVPIVPVAIVGTYDRLPSGSMSPSPGEVRIRFGDPIPTAGLGYESRESLAEQVRAAIIGLGARVSNG